MSETTTISALLSDRLARLPHALRDYLKPHSVEFLNATAMTNAARALTLAQTETLASLIDAWACSEFVLRTSLRHPELAIDLITSGDLTRSYTASEHVERLNLATRACTNNAQLATLLRHFRRREMFRIAWRDLVGLAELTSVLNELSWLAEACVRIALIHSQTWLTQQFGQALDTLGRPLSLIVIGMGKLGAYELNFSSDIDLIYCYPEDGETKGGPRSLSHSEFFIRVARTLTSLLNDVTADGFVFRVDTRLRPFGNSGQLALSFDAMESYYERHGREWERYAMIKARPIAGDEHAAKELMGRLQPFVYRRYLDFGAFDSLREMKQMIASEIARKGMEDNVKLGSGGIREIEFIGQAFQLIRGGREKALQERSILKVLSLLANLNLLPRYALERLTRAYDFLRRSENRLQAYADQQTHVLPKDPFERLRHAYAMGYADWPQFLTALKHHTRAVHDQFDQTFEAPQAETPRLDDVEILWAGNIDTHVAHDTLTHIKFMQPGSAWQALQDLKNSAACRALSPKGKERLDRLMPLLIRAVGGSTAPDACLTRVTRLIETVARRTSYLALLVEHPMALSQLVQLSAASPWIAELLTRQPILLDELLDPRRLYAPPNAQDLESELKTRLADVDADDTERQMDALRQFKQANVLRAAACELTGALATTIISDQLTFVAESSLRAAVNMAMRHLHDRHGHPRYVLHQQPHEAGFAVIAYGKLGGYELGFASDLDVVFLHDSRGENQMSDGAKPVENALFFARLGQRIIHILSTATASGVLYEVDTRLRPSGKSGLLVSNVESFALYQRNEAWTWEHQALVRARPVGGSPIICQQFNALRQETLCRERDETQLRTDVRDMRERMRTALSQDKDPLFDLKQGQGGTVDIEFIIQYLVLRNAHRHPEITDYTDNLRTITRLTEANLLAHDDAKMLSHAYVSYRHTIHAMALQQQPILAHGEAFSDMRAGVIRIWKFHFDVV